MTISYPNNRLISAHACILFEYRDIVMGEPVTSISDSPYESVNIYMQQDGSAQYPYIKDGDYIILDGDKITFTTAATVLPYQIQCDPTGATPSLQEQMAQDVRQALTILLPEYQIFSYRNVPDIEYANVAIRNNCAKKHRTLSGGFHSNGTPTGLELRTEAFVSGNFENRVASIQYEVLHNDNASNFFDSCITSKYGKLYVNPNSCDCLNAVIGAAELNVAQFLRAKMFAKFPTITDQYQPEIVFTKKDMTRFFIVRSQVSTNNDFAEQNQGLKSNLSSTLQAYNGILQPNFVKNTGSTNFDIFTEQEIDRNAPHLPLVLNPEGLRTCVNQLRFAQWWVFPRSSKNYLRVEIQVIANGTLTPIALDYPFTVFDGMDGGESPTIFQLNTGLPQLSIILNNYSISVNDVESISFGLKVLDMDFSTIYDGFYPVRYNIVKGCCCDNQVQFVFLSSIGNWETIMLDNSTSGQYEITSSDLENCMCCAVFEPAQSWQNSTKTETRNLTQIYRATLHNEKYYDGDLPSYYDGADYIKEFLSSRHVYLVKPQQLIIGNITPTPDWLFYRAVISNELPDIAESIPTVISYRLYKNSSLLK